MRVGTAGTIQLLPKPTLLGPKKSRVFKPGRHSQCHLREGLHVVLSPTQQRSVTHRPHPPSAPRDSPARQGAFGSPSPSVWPPATLNRRTHPSCTQGTTTAEAAGELAHAHQPGCSKIIIINATCNTAALPSLRRVAWSPQSEQPLEFRLNQPLLLWKFIGKYLLNTFNTSRLGVTIKLF